MGEVAASVGADMAEKYGPTLIMVAGGTIVIGGIAYFLYDEYITATAPKASLWGDSNNSIYVKDNRLAQEAAEGDCNKLINDKDLPGLYDSNGVLITGSGGTLIGSFIEGPTPPLPAYDEPPFKWQNWPPLWGIGLAGKWFGLGPFADNRTATQQATAAADQQAQKAMNDRKDLEQKDLDAVYQALENPACYLIYRDQVAQATAALQVLAQKHATDGTSPVISDQDVATAMGNLPGIYRPVFLKLQAYFNSHLNSVGFSDKLPSADTPGNTQAFGAMKGKIDRVIAGYISAGSSSGYGPQEAVMQNMNGVQVSNVLDDPLSAESILYNGHKAGCSEGDLEVLLKYTYIKTFGYRGAISLQDGYARAPIEIVAHLGGDNSFGLLQGSLTSQVILERCKYVGQIPITQANQIIAAIITALNIYLAAPGRGDPPNPINQYHDYSSVK